MTVTRTFFPWCREGFATALAGAPASGSRASLSAEVTLRGSSLSSTVPAQLAGPGDVVGLDPREILRTEPYDGAPDFEPSYFACVELAAPDLPWRFSPFGPEGEPLTDPEHSSTSVQQTLIRPWLMLVVVPASLAAIEAAPPGGLPVLSTDAAQLPNPNEAWAWAHVQVVTTDGQKPADALTDPSRILARIISPQRLVASTRYLACLVPTFAAGRAALIPEPSPATPLGPAWSGTGSVRLPVYFQWTFTTGEGGSFETFARRLRPTAAPTSLGGRPVATDHPGWGATGTPGAAVLMRGALRPIGTAEPVPDATLAESIRAAISASGVGVQLLPPIYGQHYKGGATTIPTGAQGWLAQLNTDPRRRIAAGLAAWAITVEQEDLVDRAWQQLGATATPASTPVNATLGTAVRASLGSRHASAALAGAAPPLARLARAGGPASAFGAAAVGLAAISTAVTPRGASTSTIPSVPAVTPQAPAARFDTPQPAPPVQTQFTPTFPDAAYTFLRAVAPEWLLPGTDDIPAESIVLVQSNPSFVEAFLVGLNHALAGELVWRRFPLEPTGTMFRTFWSSVSADHADVLPINAWQASSDLGTHSSSPGQLVLLIRGSLLRRFPTAVLYLSRTHPDDSEVHLTPTIAGTLGSDIAFFGFPLTPAEALHPTDPQPAKTSGWAIVIQEAVHHTRFGVEDPPASGAPALTTWQDLTWAHPHLQGHPSIPIAGPLRGLSRRLGPAPAPVATWGASSGHLAAILQRPAFRIRIPVALWLGPLTSGT